MAPTVLRICVSHLERVVARLVDIVRAALSAHPKCDGATVLGDREEELVDLFCPIFSCCCFLRR
eukprot:5818434-Prymnesium_polylepis.2